MSGKAKPRRAKTTSMRELRSQTAGMNPGEAFDAFVALAHAVGEAGARSEAFQILDEAERAFPTASRSSHAWGLNARGILLQQQGDTREARRAHESMRRIGVGEGDPHIEGSAEFALGAIAQKTGDMTEARRRYLSAYALLKRAGDRRSILQILLNIASMNVEEGALDSAARVLNLAKGAVSGSRDRALRSTLRGLQGNVAAKRGHYKTAAKHYLESLHDARALGLAVAEMNSLQSLGAAYVDLREFQQARRWYAKGVAVSMVKGSLAQRMLFNEGVALASERLGQLDEARKALEEAQALAHAAHDNIAWARRTFELAVIENRRGDSGRSLALLDQSLRLLRFGRDQRWMEGASFLRVELASLKALEAVVRRVLEEIPERERTLRERIVRAAAERMVGARDFVGAASLLREASGARRKHGDRHATAWHSAESGAILLANGGAAQAVDFFRAAVRAYDRLGDVQLSFHCRNDLANALAEAGRYEDAEREYAVCLSVGRRLRDRVMLALTSLNLGETLRRRGEARSGMARLREAARLFAALEDGDGEAASRACYGLGLASEGDLDGADEALSEALRLAKACGAHNQAAVALGGLASVAASRGRHRKAVALFSRAIAIEANAKDLRHEAESHAGLVVATAALGDRKATMRSAQRLYDLSKIIGATDAAVAPLAGAAMTAMERSHDALGAELLANVLAILVNQADRSDDLVVRMARAVGRIAGQLAQLDLSKMERRVRMIEKCIARSQGAAGAAVVKRFFDEAIPIARRAVSAGKVEHGSA